MDIGILFLVLGCARHPLGLSDAQWKAMTPSEQLEARAEQAKIDRVKKQIEAERREKERQEREREKARITDLYANAKYGDVVECSVSGGIVDFHPGWLKYHEAAFTLVPGEFTQVKVEAQGGSRTQEFWAGMNVRQTGVQLCDRDPRDYSRADCANLAGTSADFAYGTERSISLKEVFNGVFLRCAYRPTNAAEHRRVERFHRKAAKKHAKEQRDARRDPRYVARSVECVIAGGSGSFNRRWKPIQDIAFTLLPGEKRNLSMASRVGRDRTTFWAELDRAGRRIEICGYRRFGDSAATCGVIAGLSRDFERGFRKSLSVQRTFKEANIRCVYAPADQVRKERRGVR
jgi:hypothetical protein